jgi:hypothetical protein
MAARARIKAQSVEDPAKPHPYSASTPSSAPMATILLSLHASVDEDPLDGQDNDGDRKIDEAHRVMTMMELLMKTRWMGKITMAMGKLTKTHL